MRHLARHVAVFACLALTSSTADAAPRHGGHAKVAKKKKHRAKAARHVERHVATEDAKTEEVFDADDDGVDDDVQDDVQDRVFDKRDDGDRQDDEDESDEDGSEVDQADTGVTLRVRAPAKKKDWHIVIGPYLWASSVDANVSLGSANVAAGVDFIQMQKHARYGVPLLGEARFKKVTITTDFMYGVVALQGAREVGPFMVTLDGTAASLQTDGTAGYTVVGNDDSKIAIEPRVGVRYQRTVVSGAVGLNESMFTPAPIVTASMDALVGARVFVRPSKRFNVSGTGDIGVVGDSMRTWSAAVDAGVHVTTYLQASVGWRTMTTDSPNLSLVMHGPRVAIQATF